MLKACLRRFRILLLATLAIAAITPYYAPQAATPAPVPILLMPYPQQLTPSDGHWQLHGNRLAVFAPQSGAIDAALQRFQYRLQQQTGATLQPERINNAPAGTQYALIIALTQPPAETTQPTSLVALGQQQEAYHLRIEKTHIHLQAASVNGIYHGLETLLQLFALQHTTPNSTAANKNNWLLPQLSIEDYPRFAWRGLLLDSVRHFFSVETIKRQLDAMAAAKLNIFHWHLTDDQGWRMESLRYPRLHQLAADGQYYSRAEIHDVVAYAMARGIQVVPEIDLPGHSSAIAVAHPELMSAPGPYSMERRWGVHRPLLNPTNPAVYVFAEAIFSELTELFPFAYVHIGGDEVDPHDWLANDDIRRFMARNGLATAEDLHTYFNQRMAEILVGLNRHMIGWDEIFHPELPSGTVVQSWQGPDALGKVANSGHPALLSTGFYLDQPQATAYHYRNPILPQPLQVDDKPNANEHWQTWQFSLARKRGSAISGTFTLIHSAHSEQANNLRGFIDFSGKSRQDIQQLHIRQGSVYFQVDTWMGPMQARLVREGKQLRGDMIVGNAPYAVSGVQIAGNDIANSQVPNAIQPPVIAAHLQHQVLGGEAALWTEMIDERHIDLRLWPRTFAVAERLWSSAELRDEHWMYQRLMHMDDWAVQSLGLQQHRQAEALLRARIPAAQLALVRHLSQTLEPAHYYHRHHEKSAYGSYSRDDALDLFVDSLPVESHSVRALGEQLLRWQQMPSDTALAANIRNTLTEWQQSAQQLLPLLANNDPGQLADIIRQVNLTCEWGLLLMELLDNQQALSPQVIAQARRQLRSAQTMHHEVVIALAYPFEELLDRVADASAIHSLAITP